VAWEGVKNAGLAAFGEGISKALSVGIPGLDINSPQVKAWISRAQELGIPIDAGTATGNPVVRAAQYGSDRTLIGAKVAANADEAAAQGARTAVGNVAQRVSPVAQTAETAGAGLRKDVTNEIAAQHGAADTAYSALRDIEKNRGIDVDLTDLKRQLQPIRDRMYRQLPVTVRANSSGFNAVEQLLAGPDKVPLSVIDSDLSVIKAMAREADPNVRSFGQGIAAKTAGLMDAATLKAAADAGPDALAALKAGRAATRAKYAANDVLGSFAEEPVRAFNQATLKDDTGIERLRSLQKVAPDALPKVGRGYLDDLVADASQGDVFSGNKALTNWQNLGPETKKLLFPDPSMRSDLDAIFQTMKRMSANPNPSGTAHTLLMYGELGTLMASPLGGLPTMATAAGVQLTGGVVSKLLRSAAGIRALRDGLTLPLRHPQASAALQTILRTAQSVEQMPARSFAPALAAQDDSTTPTVGAAPR
jgi:phage tail protein X